MWAYSGLTQQAAGLYSLVNFSSLPTSSGMQERIGKKKKKNSEVEIKNIY